MATAYKDRIREDKAENIEKAIEHFNQALDFFTQEDFPGDWAAVQNNLATAYKDRIREDKAENVEKAIEHFNQALEIYTQEDFSVDWAMTQNNLAVAYKDRIRGHRAYNIEKAIEYFNQALNVRTLKDVPGGWAMTQYNLGLAYKDRIRGDRAKNIEKAINHLNCALLIYKLESTPRDFRKTCRLVGDLYLDKDQWQDAFKSYKGAIEAGDLLYRSGLSVESKSFEVGENAHLYRNTTLAACRLGLVNEAPLYMERGKTRLLSEALRLKVKKPEKVSNEKWMRYQQAAEEYRTATRLSDSEGDYAQREKRVQNALEELDAAVKVVQGDDPEFQKELEISDILSIPDKETVILTFCITDKGSIGYVINMSNGIQSVDIPDFKTKDLNRLLFRPNEQGFIRGGLIGTYLSYIKSLDSDRREETFNTWKNTLISVLSSIGIRLFNPLLANLPPQIKRLIILPSSGLFLLPLHAVPLSDDQLLYQRYCISYAPSIQLLKEMKNKSQTIKGKGLYAVINPQEDPSLVFSGCEGQAISNHFESRQVNVGKTGTRATVLKGIPGWAYLHLLCHGNYNWNDPPQSGLYFVGGRTLSLADLQNDEVNISSARIVTLSACETGITDIMKGSADEFVGLPAGFMLAGVPCVVSSLWAVPDISTALLMERLYSNHIVGKMDIPMALQDAQLWVRDLSSRQVADYVEKCYRSGKWGGKSKENIEQYRKRYLKLAEESPDQKPFEHPYYWAAFTVNGA